MSENTGTTETITWSTTTDWDNFTNEVDTRHPNDIVYPVGSTDDFEDLSDGVNIPSPWNDPGGGNIDSDRALGSYSFQSGGTDANNEVITSTAFEAYEGMVYRMRYNESSSQGGAGWGIEDGSGNVIWEGVTGNAQRGFTDGDGTVEYSHPNQYGTWFGWQVDNFDFTNWTHDVKVLDSNGNVENTWTGRSMASQAEPAKVWYGSNKLGSYSYTVEQASAIWWDNAFGVFQNASELTTDTKTFSEGTQPDLQNLTYTLNSQSIVLDVIGSPGTASEEVVSQTLDGSSSYSLTWSNGHTDFRITIDFRASSGSRFGGTPPNVSQVELVG